MTQYLALITLISGGGQPDNSLPQPPLGIWGGAPLPGYGGGYPSGQPVPPGRPVDPGYGRPGWGGPVDPGYGRPNWGAGRPDNSLPGQGGPVDPGYGRPGGGWGGAVDPGYGRPDWSAGRPDQGLPGSGGHPWMPGHMGGGRPDNSLPEPPPMPEGGNAFIIVWVPGHGFQWVAVDTDGKPVKPIPVPEPK
jgi:hypothetical protein